MEDNKEYVELCKLCGDKLPLGLGMTNICVKCLVDRS